MANALDGNSRHIGCFRRNFKNRVEFDAASEPSQKTFWVSLLRCHDQLTASIEFEWRRRTIHDSSIGEHGIEVSRPRNGEKPRKGMWGKNPQRFSPLAGHAVDKKAPGDASRRGPFFFL